jgi:predicted nucleic acid-binding protein
LIKNIDRIVADASFYICFLDDIECPSQLIKILDKFTVHIPHKVFIEVKKSKNIELVLEVRKDKINIFTDAPFELGEVTKAFFAKSEIAKGEHEIVVVAYLCHNMGLNFILIIDEQGPRNFTIKNMPYLAAYLTGTVGFIGNCYCDYKIFDKKESIELLEKIEKSKFRVTHQIIAETKARIEAAK